MASQRLAGGFPFPVYINETGNLQRMAAGVYVDELGAVAIALVPNAGSLATNAGYLWWR